MVENSLLFRAFDIDWYLSYLLFAGAAFLLLIVGGISLAYVLVRSGRRRPLTASELQTLGRTPEPGEIRMHWGGAAGTRVEAEASIDTLRRAAKRGDWLLFFAWPCLMSSIGVGFGLMVAGFAVIDPKEALLWFILAGVCALPFVGSGLFMPWAALYTNIDLDVDGPDLYAPERSALGPADEGPEREADRRARR